MRSLYVNTCSLRIQNVQLIKSTYHTTVCSGSCKGESPGKFPGDYGIGAGAVTK